MRQFAVFAAQFAVFIVTYKSQRPGNAGGAVQSGRQLILMHDDGTERPIEEIMQDDPTTKEFHYKSWWNQFRGPWLQPEKMTEDEIKTRADDAWECGDYQEMINLMAELICRLDKKQRIVIHKHKPASTGFLSWASIGKSKQLIEWIGGSIDLADSDPPEHLRRPEFRRSANH